MLTRLCSQRAVVLLLLLQMGSGTTRNDSAQTLPWRIITTAHTLRGMRAPLQARQSSPHLPQGMRVHHRLARKHNATQCCGEQPHRAWMQKQAAW